MRAYNLQGKGEGNRRRGKKLLIYGILVATSLLWIMVFHVAFDDFKGGV